MAITSKEKLKDLIIHLYERYNKLCSVLEGRDLTSNREGCKGRHYWSHPDNMRFIDSTELSLAIEDFSTILKELKKLK
jgi:hypothetical protein